jgi:hypothetical protein
MLTRYGLTDIHRPYGADHSRHTRPGSWHAAGEGLRRILHRFSTLGLCDNDILERQFIVYGALYAEREKRVAA